ncbi:class I SAM-dependent methyltransferase [Conexibacter sp. S30A1]|uniref:class I SAM-dependent methyltransferase n=1 Tax=Conexibacter sp. S30A1 TaxID=2937800 RepID=UPI00200C7720|nr:class I SAM-dependent methyltransferase [Conexibacter sp. S30A1]
MSRLNDPAAVTREYATEVGLATRRSLYEGLEGEDMKELLAQAVLALRPSSVLEIGPGRGELGQRLVEAGVSDYRAVDISPRMVQLVRARGLSAQVADVQALPYGDGVIACVVAAWMLYHVPDLDRALAEIARVLEPGGSLVAVTNSEQHLRELWSLVGADRFELPFSAENGEATLLRHFAAVSARPVEAWLTLPDTDAARRYISASPSRAHLTTALPDLPGPLRVGSRTCLFIATRPQRAESAGSLGHIG